MTIQPLLAPPIIDFGILGGPVFTGRARGREARLLLRLDELDRSATEIAVIVPDQTYSISSSFFLGLFEESIVAAGSKEAFEAKYFISAKPALRASIQSCIFRALAFAPKDGS
jgi:hypothetical protein